MEITLLIMEKSWNCVFDLLWEPWQNEDFQGQGHNSKVDSYWKHFHKLYIYKFVTVYQFDLCENGYGIISNEFLISCRKKTYEETVKKCSEMGLWSGLKIISLTCPSH